ncbi:hypothetical protein ACWKW1_27295 [Brevibacillus parabrevis]|jgi:hypothetical protein|uniref:hypothetical protein n=1 Tax=Brevibacillus parabrevis TaxID=54914 RepID=UPI002E1E10F4|nr:hypothetical protein [Brevibacillus parabrevis]
MKRLSLIKDIQENKLTPNELIECLDIQHNYVLSNTIRKIVILNISNDVVVEKLAETGKLLAEENTLMGIYKIGHLALAALYLLNTKESIAKYHLEISKLNEWDRDCVEKIKVSSFFQDEN